MKDRLILNARGCRVLVALARYVFAHGTTTKAARKAAAMFLTLCEAHEEPAQLADRAGHAVTFDGRRTVQEELEDEVNA